MAKQVKLSARPRPESGRNAVKQVRARGSVPAVIYGSRTAPANLEVPLRDLETILAHAVGENILVDLEIEDDGKGGARLALINEIQHHPVNQTVLHVDFKAVSVNETLVAEVVIESLGEAAGVKLGGGLLEQSLRSIEVECLPKDLPEKISVDVSALELGQSLHVRDLPKIAGVTYTADEDLTVFLVSEPKTTEEVAPAEGAATEPEVINEKKPAEGEAKEEGKKD